ncbi:MAG: MYXO-CTERM sorting domain-containing protein [Myxococcales bacterium]
MRSHLLPAVLAAAVTATLFAPRAEAVPCPTDLPVLLIVQDKSGSMDEEPCSGCDTKWVSSMTAVTDMTTKFSNRFDFGLEFFPMDANSCSYGGIVADVPSTAQNVHDQYAWDYPAGSTPTAVALGNAKTYLQSLHLTVNAYVLLITDGMPNCNASLNPATCAWTSSSCSGANSCAAESCLDDAATKTAAAALKNAGFPVYVVGFGDAGFLSNKPVLDAIAVSGGTSTSYTATDEASLTTALDTIGAKIANCCVNVCTAGAQKCGANNDTIRCVFDSAQGCTAWTTSACPNKSVCTNGSCVACNDQCTLNAFRCSGNESQKCVVGAGGCNVWQKYQTCGYGEVCTNGTCVSCSACTSGDSKCLNSSTSQTCEWNFLTGCTEWSTDTCGYGTVCTGDSCTRCDGLCAAGTRGCSGKIPVECKADAYGCTSWSQEAPCDTFCSGGACGVCGTSCTNGAKECHASKLATCGKDVNSCPVWNESDCPAGQYCSQGACAACPAACTPGTKQCAGNQVMECKQQASGCYALTPGATCTAEQVCKNGSCITPCKDECSQGATKCSGEVPYTCVTAPTGCTVWQGSTACIAPKACAEGACRSKCTGVEIETCSEPDFTCKVLPNGHLCVPAFGPDAGSTPPTGLDAGGLIIIDDEPDASSSGTRRDAGHGTSDPGGMVGGCGCSAGSAASPLALLAPLMLLGFAARRRR